MKPSAYNFTWRTDDPSKVIIFNSVTTALVEAAAQHIHLLECPRIDYCALPPGARSFVDRLKPGGFVLDDATDELQSLKFAVNATKYNSANLRLAIAPTLRCNFACTYCYEQSADSAERRDGNHASMPAAVSHALLTFIAERAKFVKGLSINWFGGEPLLAKAIVLDLSQRMIRIAEDNGIDYFASMITNGYLLNRDPSLLGKLKESRISYFQITIDGPPPIHNARRRLKGGGPTFGPILESVRLLARNEMKVGIRINVDRSNMQEALQLLDILEANGLKNVPVHLGCVTAQTSGCRSIEGSCATMMEFTTWNQRLAQRLEDGNFEAGPDVHYPRGVNVCVANRLTSFIVDPDGDLYKCYSEIGEKRASIGNVIGFEGRGDKCRTREIRWITWEPFSYPDCQSCKVLPICTGGCPYGPIAKGQQPTCAEWKYGLEQYVRARYAREKARIESDPRGILTSDPITA